MSLEFIPDSTGDATYELTVHADDDNLGEDTLVVRIHVADVDEPPFVADNATMTAREDAAAARPRP